MTAKKVKAAKKSLASSAVVTVNADGDKIVHLPDGVFVKGRADGDTVVPDETPVLVEFSADARIGKLVFRAGEKREIPRHLADSLHKVCAEVVDG